MAPGRSPARTKSAAHQASPGAWGGPGACEDYDIEALGGDMIYISKPDTRKHF